MDNLNGINNGQSALKDLGLTKQDSSTKESLGQSDFLKVLVAQMNHQDPLEPQGNADFMAQMAQFSTVDGIQEMQKSFADLTASMQSNQALQASTLVGRNVSVPGDSLTVNAGAGINGSIELPSSVSDLRLNVLDASGSLVKQINLGQHAAGSVNFNWDGLNLGGEQAPAGTYKIQAQGVIGGQAQAVPTYLNANVDSVSLGNDGGGLSLNVAGLGKVAFDSVKQISQ